VLVQGRDVSLAFDTPLVARRLLPRLRAADLIVLGHVHEDHTVALGDLRELPVFAPLQDLAAVQSFDGLMAHYGYSPETTPRMQEYVRQKFGFRPRPDARGYGDGQVWELGGTRVRALHRPGHTGGHSVLLVEPEGVAFLGDIDLSGFGPYYGDGCSSLTQFMNTLERLEEIPARVWVTSHHKGVIADPEELRALLRRFTHRIREREQALCEALAVGPMGIEELVARRFLYPPDYDELFVDDVERKTIREHLTLLMEQGRVVEEFGRYRLAARG
jgi:glyoxylase-like metal-dependent hydrolase (beta-lactamase superfamily II)